MEFKSKFYFSDHLFFRDSRAEEEEPDVPQGHTQAVTE
jgi:hypothetical protein